MLRVYWKPHIHFGVRLLLKTQIYNQIYENRKFILFVKIFES